MLAHLQCSKRSYWTLKSAWNVTASQQESLKQALQPEHSQTPKWDQTQPLRAGQFEDKAYRMEVT